MVIITNFNLRKKKYDLLNTFNKGITIYSVCVYVCVCVSFVLNPFILGFNV